MSEFAHYRSDTATKQQTLVRRRRSKLAPKTSTIAIYASVFVLLVVLIAIGYKAPQPSSSVATAVTTSDEPVTVNDVVATTIAANVAEATNLSIAPNVSSLSISTQVKSELSQSDESIISKPQIVELSTASRSIITYVTVVGDTIPSVAARYGITSETVKWANNLTSDSIEAGRSLQIVPVNGIIYVVKSGDTAQSIANKYKANADRIISYNDLEIDGLSPGLKIIIPGGILPTNERPGYTAPITYTSYFGTGFGGDTWFIKRGTPGYPGNTYAYGNCTKYAYDRRVELGLPVGANWGNAATWAYQARAQGLVVDNNPTVGAIMQNSGGFGHVGIVEAIRSNGDVEISEMNASVSGGGYNIVSGRVIPAANARYYAYIH